MASIFIQIPSYRDFELEKTVVDAVKKASGKHSLHFAIHNCLMYPGETKKPKLSNPLCKVSYEESIAPKNIGLQQARFIANSMYSGEDYYLQIDAHMRFADKWDESLVLAIATYQELGLSKPLLTMYPANYKYNDNDIEELDPQPAFMPARICFHENPQQFTDSLIPTQTAVAMDHSCGYTASVSGGFIFTLGDFHLVTPNPKIAFWGEEPLIAARAYTHGFDLVTPFEPFLWHLYHSGQPFSKAKRHHVWADFPELWSKMDTESKNEYRRIFIERIVGEYALGDKRSLDEYETFAGLDFRNALITQPNYLKQA